MVMTAENPCRVCDLVTPRRNCYFHGQLLDVQQFELETTYHSAKRWLLNRHVVGYGVVCGLDVQPADDGKGVVVQPGLAIDRMGREILVPKPSRAVALPPELTGGHGYGEKPSGEDSDDEAESARGYEEREDRASRYETRGDELSGEGTYRERRHREDDPRAKGYGKGHEEEEHVHLVLCYHECKAEPVVVLAGECCDPEPCHPGVIEERYRLELRPGGATSGVGTRDELQIPDVIEDGRVDYQKLVEWVSGDCTRCPDDPCIPLANIRIRGGDRCHPDHIDITVRPIVYGNALIFQLLLAQLTQSPNLRRG